MKMSLGIIICLFGMLLSGAVSAGCGSSAEEEYDSSSYYTSRCQCAADPNCAKRVDTDCISESECCQAFGNIGAR